MLLLTPNVLPLLLTGLNLQVQTYSELFSEAFRTHLVQVRFLSPFSYSVLLIKCIFYNSFRVIKQIGRGYLGKPCLRFLINTCVSMLPLFQLRNQVNVLKPIVCSDSLSSPWRPFVLSEDSTQSVVLRSVLRSHWSPLGCDGFSGFPCLSRPWQFREALLRSITGCSLLGSGQCLSHDEVGLCVLAGGPRRQSAVSTHHIKGPACHHDAYIDPGHLAAGCLPGFFFFLPLSPCFPDCILQREVAQCSPLFGAVLSCLLGWKV